MFKKLIARLRKKKSLEIVLDNPINNPQETEESTEESSDSYKQWLKNPREEVESLKEKIKSLENEKIFQTFENLLEDFDWAKCRKLCQALKEYNLYFSGYQAESEKIELLLFKIKKHEKRSKSNDIATYRTELFCVEPILNVSKEDWLKFIWYDDIILNEKNFKAKADTAWKAKQDGDLSDPELKKFLKKRKNTKKNRFIEEYTMKLMNDLHKEMVKERLDLNKELVEFLKNRQYAYYEYLRTGVRQKGYEKENLPNLNKEVFKLADKIGDPDLKKGLSLKYKGGNLNSAQHLINEYLITFSQYFSHFSSNWPYKKKMTKLKNVSTDSLCKLIQSSKEKFQLSDDSYVDYNFFCLGEPIITYYESYYTHGKKSHCVGYAGKYPNRTIIEHNNKTKMYAKKFVDLFLKIENENLVFEELGVVSKLRYLAIKTKYGNSINRNKLLKEIENEVSMILRIHEQTHHTPKNNSFSESWRRERDSIMDELRLANPQLAMADCISVAFCDKKDLDEIYIKACKNILAHYLHNMGHKKTKFKQVLKGGKNLQEKVENFYLLEPKMITTIGKEVYKIF